MTYEEFKIIQSTIPNEPGVYRYFSIEDEIIYIGKAKDLRKRVSSYFTKNDHTYRIQRMIKTIHRLEFTIVDTEQEAFLLENALIKNHQPRYNILLRDDKTYPFICIKKEPFPRVFLTRQVIKDGSEYLGPYTSILTVKAILSMLINIFPLRNCTLQLNKKNIEAGKFKVCLEYHIKNCLGPCQALQSEQEYMENIQQVRELLKSNFGIVQNFLKKRMNEFAEQMDFECANEFKEKIEILEAYRSKSIIVNPKLNNIDVYGYTETHEFAFINFLKIANGTVVRTRSYEIKKILNEEKEDILQRVVIDNSFADNIFVEELLFPFSISLPFDNIQITVPLAGDKKKLLDLSSKNAMYAREEKIKAGLSAEERNPSFRIMKTLKDDLKLQ